MFKITFMYGVRKLVRNLKNNLLGKMLMIFKIRMRLSKRILTSFLMF